MYFQLIIILQIINFKLDKLIIKLQYLFYVFHALYEKSQFYENYLYSQKYDSIELFK